MSIVRVGLTIDELTEKVSELESDNAGLRNRLAAAEEKRDTAESLVSHYQRCYTQRTGW